MPQPNEGRNLGKVGQLTHPAQGRDVIVAEVSLAGFGIDLQ
jgi:hypothetical protein